MPYRRVMRRVVGRRAAVRTYRGRKRAYVRTPKGGRCYAGVRRRFYARGTRKPGIYRVGRCYTRGSYVRLRPIARPIRRRRVVRYVYRRR